MPTQIAQNIQAIDLCTYIEDIKAIVISDIHIGFEESLEKQGILVPRFQFKDIVKRLDWIFSQAQIERVILNGDVKHEFGSISRQEWREVRRLIDYFRKKNVEIVAVRGNHDTIFGPLARELLVKEVKEIRHKDILIAHGDYIPAQPLKTIIIGHEHPAVTLRDKSKAEKFKCFIKTTYGKSTLIVQPAFNPLTQGTDILKEKTLSPLLTELQKAEIFIVDDETHQVLSFGKMSKLSKS